MQVYVAPLGAKVGDIIPIITASRPSRREHDKSDLYGTSLTSSLTYINMTTLGPKGGLAIAEIVFFAPALILSLFIVFRHGFTRQMGWVYLVLLSLLRLVGSGALLYSQSNNDQSVALLTTIYITNAVGTAPLLLALLGFLARVHDGMKAQATNLPDLVFRGISLLAIVGLALAIVGGIDVSDRSASASKLKTGHDLARAGSCIFLVIYLTLAAITILTFTRKSSVLTGERKLVDAGVAALPFLLVRIVYAVIVSFTTDPNSDFYAASVNVYISAFMQFLMEAIVVVIFVTAGLMTPKRQKVATPDVELNSSYAGGYAGVPTTDMPSQQRAYNKPQRSLGDYRPSRLIKDAISGR